MTIKIVVTGCYSFMAWDFIKTIIKDSKYEFVRGYDAVKYPSRLVKDEIENLELGDKLNIDHIDINNMREIPDCDYIINYAAESHVSNSIKDSIPFIDTNVKGTANLLDIIRKKENKPRLIHISTDEVYGDIDEGSFNEDSNLSPSNPYAGSKAAGDMMILAYARTHGIKYNILRPTNNFGPSQYPEKLIPLFVKKVTNGEKMPLHNMGLPKRTWTHITDTTSAVMTMMNNWNDNQIYNCSGEYEISNLDLCNMIVEILFDNNYDKNKIMDLYDFSFNRPGQDIRYSLNCDKLKNLGWSPKTKNNFLSLLKETVISSSVGQ